MELAASFPKRFGRTQESTIDRYRNRIVAELNWVVTEDNKFLKEIERIDHYFASLIDPKNLDASSPDNILIKQRREFEAICAALKSRGIADPDRLTIFRFFATIEYFESLKSKQK